MTTTYSLSETTLGDAEIRAVTEVLRSGWLSLGPRTEQFEARFAEYAGARDAVAVSSCTAALHLALRAVGVAPGDEVLVPSYTFVASANAVLYQGATPVFVDILGAHDLNLDPADLERKVTPRTKAIVVVHLAGFLADMDRIMTVARRHGLAVVEDASHAPGARYASTANGDRGGRMAGTIGDAGCFSFFANKNLAVGEGGMFVTGDSSLARRVRSMRSHAMTASSWDKESGRAADYDVTELGWNYRCTEITAALGLAQLAKLDAANARRRDLVGQYRGLLARAAGVTLPFGRRDDDSAHHIFPILLDDPEARGAFRRALLARGIQTSVHYKPVHLFSHYRPYRPRDGSLARTEAVSAREVTLPLHPRLDTADVTTIATAVVDIAPCPHRTHRP